MSWFAVDDRFWQHRKTMRLRRSPHFAQAIAVWTLAGSWAAGDPEAKQTGVVPLDVIAALGIADWSAAIDALLMVGLLEDGSDEDSIVFHDWEFWNGPNAKAKRIEKRMEDDRIRQQRRRAQAAGGGWSRDQGEMSRDHPPPSRDASRDGPVTTLDGHVNSGNGKGFGFGSSSPSVDPLVSSPRRRSKPGAREDRDDARRLCEHLAERIESNGSKRPTITIRWLDAARLLIDADGRTEDQVHRAIDWCQDDEFWRSNVLSMPKLREKYDQMRLRAQQSNGRASPDGAVISKTDAALADLAARKAALLAARENESDQLVMEAPR